MPTREHLKPDRPVSALIFPPDGGVRGHIEHPPRIKTELEAWVAERFHSALIDRGIAAGTSKSLPEDDRADFELKVGGSWIDVQIVEVVDGLRRRLREQRWGYLEAMFTAHPTLARELAGLRVAITDAGRAPLLPPVISREGEIELSSLVAEVVRISHEINSGSRRSTVRYTGPSGVLLHLTVEKHDKHGFISWGGGRFFDREDDQNLVAQAVASKLKKRYAVTSRPLWLLAYSTDATNCLSQDHDAHAAWWSLETVAHSFAETWFLEPKGDHSSLLKLWPRDDVEHDGPECCIGSGKWKQILLPEDTQSFGISLSGV